MTHPLSPLPSPLEKPPRLILQGNQTNSPIQIYAFPPNRETLGGSAYLIVEEANILVDCPAWNSTNQYFLQEQGVQWLVLTHRGGIGQAREIQQALQCQILIQEQEAYLLPGLTVTSFQQSFTLTSRSHMVWTPGHSPGSACLYCNAFGGVLFSGRHLLPNPRSQLMPIKTAKTFHWPRQLKSTQKLLAEFTPETLEVICPGANIGFLRGQPFVHDGYKQLQQCRHG